MKDLDSWFRFGEFGFWFEFGLDSGLVRSVLVRKTREWSCSLSKTFGPSFAGLKSLGLPEEFGVPGERFRIQRFVRTQRMFQILLPMYIKLLNGPSQLQSIENFREIIMGPCRYASDRRLQTHLVACDRTYGRYM
jgi:hypothetical protein